MRNIYLIIITTAIIAGSLHAQMIDAGDTLYGNEWIDYEQTYFKVKVAEDGVYRISGATLQQAGVPIESIQPGQYQLFWMGKEQPVYISSESTLGSEDFLEFYGKKNRSELDRFLFENPEEEMLNPAYSMHTDTATYFLSWAEVGSGLRYQNLENSINDPLPPSAPWYWYTEEVVFTESHFKPTISSQGVRFSTYVEGEGFCSRALVSQSFNINASNIYADGPAAKLSYRISGRLFNHDCTVDLNGQNIATYITSPSQLIVDEKSIAATELMASNKIDLISQLPTDRLVIGQAALQYPRAFPLNSSFSMHLTLPADTIERTISLSEEGSSNSFVIYDQQQQARLVVTGPDAIIPAGMTQLYLAEVGSIAALEITAAIFEPLVHSDASFVFITSKKFLEEPSNHLADYVAYRSSDAGRSFKVLTVYTEDLYDQFAYGVNYHPLSIKNWSNFAATQCPDLEFVYLVGKGFHYTDVRKEADKGFLPVYGLPGSDNLLLSKGSSAVPNFATGHLAAQSQEDIKIYLDKITIMEDLIANAPQTIEDRLWMKRVLHLSGGNKEGNERLVLQNNLIVMGELLQKNKFGAQVTALSKQTEDIIDKTINDNIVNLVNSGVMIKTYFGHGGTTITELDGFEHPDFYSNTNRYPVMISLGCHTGDIFTPVISLSEENVIAQDLGAIVYLATSGLGFISSLNTFGNDWYNLIGTEYYTEALGNSIREVIIKHDGSSSVGNKTLIQQLIFHGDPAYKIRSIDRPDYIIDESSFKTIPEVVNSFNDSVILNFDLYNIGSVVGDSVSLSIIHFNGNQEVNQLLYKTVVSKSHENININLDIGTPGLFGNNEVVISIDPDNSIQESPNPQAEKNNTIGFEFFIQDDAIIPIYPSNYGIVGEPNIEILVTTSNGFSPSKMYIFEMDTIKLFSSPIKETAEVEGQYAIKWNPTQSLIQDAVYYWRVKPKTNSENVNWLNRSFVYIPNQTGWNQSHLYQFKENEFEGMKFINNTPTFDSSGWFITIYNHLSSNPDRPGYQFNFESFAASINPWNFMDNGIAIVVLDPKTGKAWTNGGGDYGSINTTKFTSFRCFGFPTNTSSDRNKVVTFLEDSIPSGHYIFFFSIIKNELSDLSTYDWGSDIANSLKPQGSMFIDSLIDKGPLPYSFMYIKDVKIIDEKIGSTINSKIITQAYVGVPLSSGKLKTEVIGPSSSWEKLIWKGDSLEEKNDELLILSSSKEDTILHVTKPGEYDLSFIDITTYDFISLDYSFHNQNDKINLPEEIKIFFDGYPEYLFGDEIIFNEQNNLIQGQDIKLSGFITNTSPIPGTDSLNLLFQIKSSDNQTFNLMDKYPPIKAKVNFPFSVIFSTNDLGKNNFLKLEINPPISTPEKIHSNNFAYKNFSIKVDENPPILIVKFDDKAIINHEIISPNPNIKFSAIDENQFLLIDDPNQFEIQITNPNNEIKKYDTSSEIFSFSPATVSKNNVAEVTLTPTFEFEGFYNLRAKVIDKNGNSSGVYDVNFQIDFELKLSQLIIYPNPVRSFINFEFILSGPGTPDNLIISIYSINGSLLKEIDLSKEDKLRIGFNKIQLYLDDLQFGIPILSGIYIYKIENLSDSDLNLNNIISEGKIVVIN